MKWKIVTYQKENGEKPPMGDTFVLLHGFVKKTDKIPKREIETAKQYMEDYKRRFENNE